MERVNKARQEFSRRTRSGKGKKVEQVVLEEDDYEDLDRPLHRPVETERRVGKVRQATAVRGGRRGRGNGSGRRGQTSDVSARGAQGRQGAARGGQAVCSRSPRGAATVKKAMNSPDQHRSGRAQSSRGSRGARKGEQQAGKKVCGKEKNSESGSNKTTTRRRQKRNKNEMTQAPEEPSPKRRKIEKTTQSSVPESLPVNPNLTGITEKALSNLRAGLYVPITNNEYPVKEYFEAKGMNMDKKKKMKKTKTTKKLSSSKKSKKSKDDNNKGDSDDGSGELCDCGANGRDCSDQCYNRSMCQECPANCTPAGGKCMNRMFSEPKFPRVQEFNTRTKKGKGLRVSEFVKKGTMILEFNGEIISEEMRISRQEVYTQHNKPRQYMMSVGKGLTVDITLKGGMGRFVNHSCVPNCFAEAWDVPGTLYGHQRIGLFASVDLKRGTEITFDYDYQPDGDPIECLCGSEDRCRKWIGKRKNTGNLRAPLQEL